MSDIDNKPSDSLPQDWEEGEELTFDPPLEEDPQEEAPEQASEEILPPREPEDDPQEPPRPTAQYRRACFIATVLLVTVMAQVGAMSFFLPKATKSVYEKRDLAKFPVFSTQALFRGSWLKDFELYYADTFPARDSLIRLGAGLNDLKGLRGADDIKIYDGNSSQAQPSSPSAQAPAAPEESQAPGESQSQSQGESSSAAPPEVPDGYLTQGYCIVGDRGLTLFGGNRDVAKQYAGILTAFADRLEGQAKVYNIVVPTSGEFYLPPKYQSLSNSQKNNIEYLYSQLGPNVTGVDAYSWLELNKDKYLYFRTDHHWTGLGAYYAYVAFCRETGQDSVSLSDLEKRSIPNFLGTIYNSTRDPRLESNPDVVDYYITAPNATAFLTTKAQPEVRQPVAPWAEFAAGGNAYGVFIWADNPVFEMDNPDVQNGEKVLILKESFGNAFAPWLMHNYQTVYVIDYRHYEKSVYDFVRDNGIGTVIFINNAFAANTGFHAQRIDYLCNQLP